MSRRAIEAAPCFFTKRSIRDHLFSFDSCCPSHRNRDPCLLTTPGGHPFTAFPPPQFPLTLVDWVTVHLFLVSLHAYGPPCTTVLTPYLIGSNTGLLLTARSNKVAD